MLYIGTAKFDQLESLEQSLRQSLRKHHWDLNTRYRDSKRFEDGVPLRKGYKKIVAAKCGKKYDIFQIL